MESHFSGLFGEQPTLIQESPGRVNIIGEHIDYNGGMVLPAAIPLGLTIAMRPRTDDRIRVSSAQYPGIAEATLDSERRADWAGHAVGAIIYAVREGLMPGGADVLVESTMPDGAGLSSSAALVVGVLKAARAHGHSDMSNTDLAKLARIVENEFIGVPCGIMDQMAVAISHPGQALALDTKTLNYDLIDLPATHHFAIIHSGIRRRLSDGRYGQMKEECDEAKEYLGTEDLCLLSEEELKRVPELAPRLQKRVVHCITEHTRTKLAVSALKLNDIDTLGRLMNESHVSMRDNFTMSTPEIDHLVADAVDLGAVGARLTGGGFGGCIVACVPTENMERWKTALLERHSEATFIC